MDKQLNDLLNRPENKAILAKVSHITPIMAEPLTLRQRLNLWQDIKIRLTANECRDMHDAFGFFLDMPETEIAALYPTEQLAILYMLEKIRFWKTEMYKSFDSDKPRLLKLKYEDTYVFFRTLCLKTNTTGGQSLHAMYAKIHQAVVSHLPPHISDRVTELTTPHKQLTF